MTQEIEVTPEVLEAVAGAVFDTAIPTEVAHTLRDWAGSLRAEANPYAVEIGQLVLGVESSGSKESWFVRIGLAVLDKLDADGRLVPEGQVANAWDEGFEAGCEYVPRQSTPSGICPDPPLNPYLPSVTATEPVERCRCGVLEDEPSEGCEWHTARPENAEATLRRLPIVVGSRIRGSARRWSSAREWTDTNPYIDTFTLDERGYWCAENDELVIVPGQLQHLDVLEILHVGPEQWASWEDVPEGVAFKCANSAQATFTLRRKGDCVTRDYVGWVDTDTLDEQLAPFVRAAGK